MFQFELVVTEKCNLHCKYCYMINKSKHMTKEVFDAHYAALPRIMDAYGEEMFTTTFFGGEPLLNWDIIEYILPIVNTDPKCQGVTMPTNGLLFTQEMINTLKKYNVNVSLSFDGLWQENEFGELAMRKGGEMVRYMNIVKDLGVDTCKVMISPQSHRPEFSLKRNYKWFVEEFGMNNPDFTLVRDDVWEPLDIAVFQFEIKELADQVIKYIKEGIDTMPGIFTLNILDTLVAEKFSKRSFGCFAGISGLGFMPDGKAYPCARFGSAGEYEIFDSFAEDVYVEWNFDNYKKFINKNFTDPRTFEECKKCVLYKYCNAGCTYSQLNSNGGHPLKSICELYKASYEQAFRIVEELKDNETFKKIMENMIRRIP